MLGEFLGVRYPPLKKGHGDGLTFGFGQRLGFAEVMVLTAEEGFVTGVWPDFFYRISSNCGILAEVERCGTVNNNHDLKDLWKAHISRDARHLFLVVTNANWTATGAVSERPFVRVIKRLAVFFGDKWREIDVVSLHVFSYGHLGIRASEDWPPGRGNFRIFMRPDPYAYPAGLRKEHVGLSVAHDMWLQLGHPRVDIRLWVCRVLRAPVPQRASIEVAPERKLGASVAGAVGEHQAPNRLSSGPRPIRRRLGQGTGWRLSSGIVRRTPLFRGAAPPVSGRRWNVPAPSGHARARNPKCGSQRHSITQSR